MNSKNQEFKKIVQKLNEYSYLEAKIQLLELEMKELANESDRLSIEASAFSAEERILENDNKILKLRCKQNELKFEKERIEVILNGLSKREREIIELKYFQKESWKSIAKKLKCSNDSCIRYRNNIFETINDIMKRN